MRGADFLSRLDANHTRGTMFSFEKFVRYQPAETPAGQIQFFDFTFVHLGYAHFGSILHIMKCVLLWDRILTAVPPEVKT